MAKDSTYLAFSLFLYYLSGCTSSTGTPAPAHKPSREEIIARGRYIVMAGGCADCHSPKVFTPTGPAIDSTRLLSGSPANGRLPEWDKRAFQPGYWSMFSPDATVVAGPWGVSFAANITPDSATGIGAWTEEVFIRSIRTGRHLGQEGGRPILPPMPWRSLAHLSDEDLAAIFAYLKELPPVHNQVPAPLPPMPPSAALRNGLNQPGMAGVYKLTDSYALDSLNNIYYISDTMPRREKNILLRLGPGEAYAQILPGDYCYLLPPLRRSGTWSVAAPGTISLDGRLFAVDYWDHRKLTLSYPAKMAGTQVRLVETFLKL